MQKSKLSAILSLALVFLSGALVGGFVHRLYMVKTVLSVGPAPPHRPDPEEFRRQRLAEMKNRVKVDDQQLLQIEKIYDETKEQFDRIRREMNEEGKKIDDSQVAKIKAVLRPDQIPVYDQIRAEREAARKQRRLQQQQFEKK